MQTTHPLPPAHDPEAAVAWVRDHLSDVVDGEVAASPRFRGGQTAADASLAALDVSGYARDRNQVRPTEQRGATGLSPYIRHGLLPLPLVWDAVADAPARDRGRFRDELLWQEHARHLYARLGGSTRQGLRRELHGDVWAAAPVDADALGSVWDPAMACLRDSVEELTIDGYAVNQARLWLASHWAVRAGVDWRAGEDAMFRHLLDGSRAANRAGWQWTVGTGSGRAYGFARSQVLERAPALCGDCELRDRCPIEDWPDEPPLLSTSEHPRLRRDADPVRTRGPAVPQVDADPEVVWLTAESLGDADPALAAHPERPAVFVFDRPLLARLRLAGQRLVFLIETLSDLAQRVDLDVVFGDPVAELAGRRIAATYTPVPGWRQRASQLEVTALHPWPWLVPPHGGSVASFSAWRKAAGR